MSGKFGADFNENQPSDSDLVKKGAQWIRDIKARLKSFLGVLFNLETGDLKDNVIRSGALRDLNPSPAGTHTRVVVNAKGQVTSGDSPDNSLVARIYRYTYEFAADGAAGGVAPDGSSILATGALDDDGNTVAQYSFTFPADVTRVRVRVQAAGGGSAATKGGAGGGAYIDAVVEGSEGDVWLIWVGQSTETGLGTPAHSADSKFEFSGFKYLRCGGGLTSTVSDGSTGGVPDVAGVSGAIQVPGGDGTSTTGGASGCGAGAAASNNFSTGAGATPATGAGANGFVVVEYWGS